MSISRRDFFAEAFGKAASHMPKIIPTGVRNLLGIEKDKPLSAEDAAFALTKTRRKNSLLTSLADKYTSNSVRSVVKDETENK